jgi:hypothetical protein
LCFNDAVLAADTVRETKNQKLLNSLFQKHTNACFLKVQHLKKFLPVGLNINIESEIWISLHIWINVCPVIIILPL